MSFFGNSCKKKPSTLLGNGVGSGVGCGVGSGVGDGVG